MVRLSGNISSLISGTFKKGGFKKKTKTAKILGCSYEHIYEQFESQFTDGMTWENQGEWHVDHRLPISAAKTEKEILKLNHHSNLQPMWGRDNIIKKDSYCPKQLKEYLKS